MFFDLVQSVYLVWKLFLKNTGSVYLIIAVLTNYSEKLLFLICIKIKYEAHIII